MNELRGGTMSINVKAVLDTWEWLTLRAGQGNDPEWYQGTWAARWGHEGGEILDDYEDFTSVPESKQDGFCGTTCCVAGYLLREHLTWGDEEGTLVPGDVITNHEGERLTVTNSMAFDIYGAHVLGITPEEARGVFTDTNTRDDIREVFNILLEKYGEEVRL